MSSFGIPCSRPRTVHALLLLIALVVGLPAFARADGPEAQVASAVSGPEWNFKDSCVSLLVRPDLHRSLLGIPNHHVSALSLYSSRSARFVALRLPVPGSFRFHSDPNAVAKPMKVWVMPDHGAGEWITFSFKSARSGPYEGLVVQPSVTAFPGSELQAAEKIWTEEWPRFRDAGYHVDADGIVRSPVGQMYFSDYDLIGMFDFRGNRIDLGRDGDHVEFVQEQLRPLNESIGAILFRHDGYFEASYYASLRTLREDVLMFTPDGSVYKLPAPEVHKVLEEISSISAQ